MREPAHRQVSRDHAAAGQVSAIYVGADARHRRAVGGHAHRAADERRRPHDLHAVDQRQRRHHHAATCTSRSAPTPTPPTCWRRTASRRRSRALPPSVNAYGLTVKKTFASPLLVFALYSPSGSYDNRFLANYATINLTDQLLRVPGVGDVQGLRRRRLLHAHLGQPRACSPTSGSPSADLVRAVQRQSTVNPAGQLGAEPVPTGPGVHVHHPRQGAADDGGRVRRRHRARQPRRLGRAPQGRRAHRARHRELQPDRPLHGARTRPSSPSISSPARTRSQSPTRSSATMADVARRASPAT